jgi:2,3-bisphosphoglycerate-dependent phosphoglycerate mutase
VGLIERMNCSEIYFVRHGETDANIQELISGGDWDIPLNETGQSQAEHARETLAGLEIRTICSSPLSRARETASIINRGRDLPVSMVPDLAEWRLGDWCRQEFAVAGDAFWDTDPPGGETRAEFFQRALQGFEQCLTYPGPVLIAAHGGIWRSLQEQFGISSDWIPNCEPHVFRRVSGRWATDKV